MPARNPCRYFVLAMIAASPQFAQALRNAAAERGIRIGTAVDPSHFSEAAYTETLAREFNQVEPENAMKFGPIHPGPTTYSFGQPDSIVAFAKAHNMAVRGHTLVWHNQNPTWVTNGNYTPAQLSAILQDHIQTVVGHYAGQVYAWDVVNEAFNDNGTIRSTIWSDSPGIGRSGTGTIEQSLIWAHAADPQALLFYNDYSAEGLNSKSTAIFNMAQDFIARGIPLHGIGMQMHFTTSTGSLANIDANIKRITDLGLQVQITELDVRLPVDATGVATSASLATEAQIYHDIITICLKYPRCTAIQTWGFTDKYSWIPGTYPGFGAALEFDTGYQPKPAYSAILNAMQTAVPVIDASGLVNAASYAGGAAAPGELIAMFGATFGPASLTYPQPDASGILPSICADVRLLFDGVPAPIIYARAGQVGAVVPFSVAGKSLSKVEYEFRGMRSNAVTIGITAAAPALFTLDQSGRNTGAILDVSYRAVTAANPVHNGDVILLFATGGGINSGANVDGQIFSADPYPAPLAPVTVKIGGVDCSVEYAGGAAGLVAGVIQINVRIAAGVAAGEQPVTIYAGGVPSPSGVTTWIR